ncbi:MAG: metallophosphoesterase [Myxococcales bacterium]|nr:metallophosphoesterase [Myxococcales bacterium]
MARALPLLVLVVGSLGAACSGTSESSPEVDAAAEETLIDAALDALSPDAPSPDVSTGDGTPADTSDTGSGVGTDADGGPAPGDTPPNLKVAFVGDQGNNANTVAVMALAKKEGAQAIFILGDYDYGDSPTNFAANLDKGVGTDFPVFAVVGNHDVAAWSGYKTKIDARLAKIPDASCTGEYGSRAACKWRGLFFVTSGVGTMGTGHETYLQDQLAKDASTWRVCLWHKNQHDMQIGGKGDEVGWKAYQICQAQGAMVWTGHEHSYARTKTLTALGDKAKAYGATGLFDQMVVQPASGTTPGSTFVIVSGLGGVEVRDFEASHATDTWWAAYYANNAWFTNGTKPAGFKLGFGATFLTFHVDGDPKKARGYFKNLAGVEIDRFEVTRK